MSGTSLDGVDAVLSAFPGKQQAAYLPFPADLKHELMALQSPTENEIHRESMAANRLVQLYAECIRNLLASAQLRPDQIRAIGAHGQTIRHLPASGYTRQINNPALLAELTGIDVVADFRSRDVAAGGQGAPLVPAFHQAVFSKPGITRVIANIGGISNISLLRADGSLSGFDTGPGNMLMDSWINTHLGAAYDKDGHWAAGGKVNPALLDALFETEFLRQPPPKSTGRDLFNADWLAAKIQGVVICSAQDVQATLAAFTALTLSDAIKLYAGDAMEVYVCGGGAYNAHLMQLLHQALPVPVASTAQLGVSPSEVEALAFAWLAARFCERLPGNVPAVTGARGSRILGALYPA
jgi:anhydro-N-acetylmuramic acid kinase